MLVVIDNQISYSAIINNFIINRLDEHSRSKLLNGFLFDSVKLNTHRGTDHGDFANIHFQALIFHLGLDSHLCSRLNIELEAVKNEDFTVWVTRSIGLCDNETCIYGLLKII